MTHTPTRRSVAKGAAWSIPAVAVASAAPAVAASPCAGIVKGQALPASAFAPAYFIVTNQTFGGVANKSISIAAGVSVSSAVQSCVGAATMSLTYTTSSTGSLTLTNGTTYAVTGGAGIAGGGTAGTANGGCSGPSGLKTQTCVTYTGLALTNSTGTSSANPRSGTFTFAINVTGFGTTTLRFNVPSFTQDGTNWDGTGVSVA